MFNSLLRCYSIGKAPLQAYLLYQHLKQLHFLHAHDENQPSFDSFTYSFLLKASANSRVIELGTGIHGLVTRLGFDSCVYVQTALVNMYVVAGNTVYAWNVFVEMPEKNAVTWNVMITGLINWGDIQKARQLLEKMPGRTVVSWTTVIDGYIRMNLPGEAIFLFSRMVACDGIRPNDISVLTLLLAVWHLGDIRVCNLVHGYVVKRGFVPCDIHIMNSLINSYAKCGCIQSSFKFFGEMPKNRKNLVSWTSMISAFAMHGMGIEAINVFKDMEISGLNPNSITLLSVLKACSHGGLAEEGLEIFNKMMSQYNIVPNIKHYGCVIDMLGRTGRLEEAEKIALEIPKNKINTVVWRILQGACSVHGDAKMGKRVTQMIMELEKGNGGDYVLMSNIFSRVGRFDDAQEFRQLMDRRKVIKVPGHSQWAY